MNDLPTVVRNCMRARLLDAQIVGEKQIQLPNAAFTKPTSGIWIRESINEGKEEPVSNAAAREFMVVNYEVFGKAAEGTAAVDATVAAICREFHVVGMQCAVYNQGGQAAVIRDIDKPAGGIDSGDPAWYRRLVAITLELYNP